MNYRKIYRDSIVDRRAKEQALVEVRGLFASLELHEAIRRAAASILKKHDRAQKRAGQV